MKVSPVVVITGAANGIGRATAYKYAENGFALSLVDNDRDNLRMLESDLEGRGVECISMPGDLADSDFVAGIVESTIRKLKRIDVLINNAAWRTVETLRSISVENWERTIKICLTAPAYLSKYAAAAMEKDGIPGVIINVTSIMSRRVGGMSPAYVACKGGLETLTYELAVLYGPKGIRVLAVRPGNIETNLSSDYIDDRGVNISEKLVSSMNDLTPLLRAGRPEEIANALYWLATSEASFITGTCIDIDGGFGCNMTGYANKKLLFPDEF